MSKGLSAADAAWGIELSGRALLLRDQIICAAGIEGYRGEQIGQRGTPARAEEGISAVASALARRWNAPPRPPPRLPLLGERSADIDTDTADDEELGRVRIGSSGR